jgi:hypothetical protein
MEKGNAKKPNSLTKVGLMQEEGMKNPSPLAKVSLYNVLYSPLGS